MRCQEQELSPQGTWLAMSDRTKIIICRDRPPRIYHNGDFRGGGCFKRRTVGSKTHEMTGETRLMKD